MIHLTFKRSVTPAKKDTNENAWQFLSRKGFLLIWKLTKTYKWYNNKLMGIH